MTELLVSFVVAILKVISQDGEAISEFIRFVKIQKGNDLRAAKLTDVTRGLQYATETGDTSQLETAIRNYRANGSSTL